MNHFSSTCKSCLVLFLTLIMALQFYAAPPQIERFLCKIRKMVLFSSNFGVAFVRTQILLSKSHHNVCLISLGAHTKNWFSLGRWQPTHPSPFFRRSDLTKVRLTSPWFRPIVWVAQMSRLWNFSVRVQFWFDKIESDTVLIAKILKSISPIRQCKIIYSILPHEAMLLLELFCLLQNTIGWRQNSSSSAFALWGKIDTCCFLNFLNY